MGWLNGNSNDSFECNPELLIYFRKRRGFTQSALAVNSGYSQRLICKAESGKPISAAAIDTLAQTLSIPAEEVHPEDLISDPVALSKKYIEALHRDKENFVDTIAHFLDDEVVFHMAGDPSIMPFAGSHHGIDAIKAAVKTFFSMLSVPEDRDHTADYQYIGQGNEAIIWGESWMQPIGRPKIDRPVQITHRMRFRRGKLYDLDDRYDTLTATQLLGKMSKE